MGNHHTDFHTYRFLGEKKATLCRTHLDPVVARHQWRSAARNGGLSIAPGPLFSTVKRGLSEGGNTPANKNASFISQEPVQADSGQEDGDQRTQTLKRPQETCRARGHLLALEIALSWSHSNLPLFFLALERSHRVQCRPSTAHRRPRREQRRRARAAGQAQGRFERRPGGACLRAASQPPKGCCKNTHP